MGYKIEIGESTTIGSQCYFLSHVKIGNRVNIGDVVRIEPGVVIDDEVRVPPGTWIRRGAHITKDTKFDDDRWQVISR